MIEAFVMQASLTAMNSSFYHCIDDLLAVLQAFVSRRMYSSAILEALPASADSDAFKWYFLSEMYRVLGLQFDYDTHPQQILQNNLIQRCLSTQASLGYAGASMRPSLSAIVAQTILDLRYVAYAYLAATKAKVGPDTDANKPGQSS